MSQADSFDRPEGMEGLGEGVSELESDCEVVSGLASGLYVELERLILAHGQDAAAGLVPLAVATLESLQGASAESRAKRAEAEREREENRRLLAQYERERAERKRIEEKCLELEDLMENDRKTQRARLELAAAENRQMEVKARNYADMLFQLEEEKVALEREHNKLLQTYSVVLRNLKDFQALHKTQPEEGRYSGSSTPLPKRCQEQSQSTGDCTDIPSSLAQEEGQSQADSDLQADMGDTAAVSGSPTVEMERPLPVMDPVTQGMGEEVPVTHTASHHREHRDCEIQRILETTPELLEFPEVKQIPKASTPGRSEDEGVDRNTDSILQELQNLGSEFIEELDEGLDLLDPGSQLENLATENAELREKHAAADCARRNLISRVEELVRERVDLKQELEQSRLVRTALEKKLAASQRPAHSPQLGATERPREHSEYDEVSSRQPRNFTRAEMSRVLTERNLYKERLMELQEAVRRMDTVRTLKEHQNYQAKRSTLWERFYQLLGRSSVPQVPMPRPLFASMPQRGSDRSLVWDDDRRNSSEGSSRDQQGELYSQIHRHIWRELGKGQIQGWSHPPKEALEMGSGGPFATPALVQVRLLDQKDPSTKLCCAAGVQVPEGTLPPSGSLEVTAKGSTGTLWICSATRSETEVMVVDATRASHILDHFTLTNCRVLCAASVPASRGMDEEGVSSGRSGRANGTHRHKSSEPTVWLGSQSGSVFIYVGWCCRRRCLHMLQLADSVHSIQYSGGFVAATLENGTLSIFHRNQDGTWDLDGYRCVDLGLPRQPVRCAVPVHNKIWCGCRNRVYVINPRGPKTEKWFDVVSQAERQVRHLAYQGDGVWVSVRFESVLRLFHAVTGQPLQEVDVLPFVIGQFGSGPPALSFLQVTAMSVICQRLWIGTGTGFVVSVPLSSKLAAGSIPCIANGTPAGQEDPLQAVTAVPIPSIPYCVMSLAQICFHGHRHAVRFFVSVLVSSSSITPGFGSPADSTPPAPSEDGLSELIVSGGEGYINFRIGVDSEMGDRSSVRLKSERSHLIVSRMRR